MSTARRGMGLVMHGRLRAGRMGGLGLLRANVQFTYSQNIANKAPWTKPNYYNHFVFPSKLHRCNCTQVLLYISITLLKLKICFVVAFSPAHRPGLLLCIIIKRMGNICNSNTDTSNAKESVDTLVRVKINGTTVQIIYGNYRELRAECLINIFEDTYLKNNTVLSESTQNPKEVINNIESSRKRSLISDAQKGLPFKKVVNCALPAYTSTEQREYITLVVNLLREAINSKSREYMLVFSQTNEFNSLPNQLIVGLVFGMLLQTDQKKPLAERVRLVSHDKNICNLFKLELSKVYAQHRTSLEFERVRLYQIENEILY